MGSPMTRSWQEIIAHYLGQEGDSRSLHALATLAQQVNESPLAAGLFAWTSMLDLCIVQKEVSYPYDGPLLRLSPMSKDRLEFRYEDTWDRSKQWHRIVDARDAMQSLLKFLDQLRWFPQDILESLEQQDRLMRGQSSRT